MIFDCGVNQQYITSAVQRNRAALDAMGHNDELTILKHLIAIPKFHKEATFVHKEQPVLVLAE